MELTEKTKCGDQVSDVKFIKACEAIYKNHMKEKAQAANDYLKSLSLIHFERISRRKVSATHFIGKCDEVKKQYGRMMPGQIASLYIDSQQKIGQSIVDILEDYSSHVWGMDFITLSEYED